MEIFEIDLSVRTLAGRGVVRSSASILLAGLLALLVRGECGAQPVRVGERIRVTAPPVLPSPQSGTLAFIAADTLVLESAGMDLGSVRSLPTRWVVPRDLITDLERSLGRQQGRGTKGLLIGAGIGLVGSFLAISSGDFNACRGSGDYGEFCAYIVAGATVGSGLIGLAIGALSASEQWQALAPSEAF